MNQKIISIGDIKIGSEYPIVLIAGPCVLESEYVVMHTAEYVSRLTDRLKIPYIFKSSFDKANRSSIFSYRGPGLENGLKLLEKVKSEFGIPVITDIHLPDHAIPVSSVVDVIQIPAFLCRQTDLLIAASKTGKPVNVKKGQFMSPWEMKNVVNKLEESNNHNIMLTERGTCFGYNNLVVDMTSLVEMRKFGYPIIFDATHSVQKPGGLGTATGGNKEYVQYLSRAATAVGIHGLFLEVHPDVKEALSDGASMINLEELESLLKTVKHLDGTVKQTGR